MESSNAACLMDRPCTAGMSHQQEAILQHLSAPARLQSAISVGRPPPAMLLTPLTEDWLKRCLEEHA